MRIRNKVAVAVMKLRQTVPMARHRPGQVDQSPPSPITWKDNTTVGPSAHSDKEDAAGKIMHTLSVHRLFLFYLFIFSGAPEIMASHKHAFPRASNPGQAALSFANLSEDKRFKK